MFSHWAIVLLLTSIQILAPAAQTPVRAGSTVRYPLKVRDVRPIYSQKAQAARIQGIVIIDADARIEYVNDRYLRMRGLAREDLIGQRASLLQSGTASAEALSGLCTELQEGRSWRGEFANRRVAAVPSAESYRPCCAPR